MRNRDVVHLVKAATGAVLLAVTLTAAAEPAPPNGTWRLSVDIEGALSDLRTVVRFDTAANGQFEGHSRHDALRDMAGFLKSVFGSMFKSNLEHGAWLHIVDGRATGDGALTARLTTAFTEALGLRCRHASQALECDIHRERRRVGSLRAKPTDTALPITDYAIVHERIRAATDRHYHRPERIDEGDWAQFWQALRKGLARAQDDLDALVAWNLAEDEIDGSHYELLRGGPADDGKLDDPAQPATAAEAVSWRLTAGDIGVLRVSSFDLPAAAMAETLALSIRGLTDAGARALVLDLRGTGGQGLGWLALAGHLASEPAPMGYLLTRRWWQQHDEPPSPAGADEALPRQALAGGRALTQRLRGGNGAFLVAESRTPGFDGPLAAVIDKGTAGGAELLAHGLRASAGARLIGRRSAGKTLRVGAIDLDDGWSLRLPLADAYAADGRRLEGKGVEPDAKADSGDALERALAELRERLADEDAIGDGDSGAAD